MKRPRRLSSPRDFTSVFQQGTRASTPLVGCAVAVGDSESPPRFGFVATKKLGGAVARNRAKRLLREAAAAAVEQVRPGARIVLTARPGITGKTFQEVRQAVLVCLQKAGGTC